MDKGKTVMRNGKRKMASKMTDVGEEKKRETMLKE